MECKVATWFFHDVLRERKTRCKETRNLEMHRPTRAVPWNYSGTGSLTQQRAQHGDVYRKDLRRRRKWINSPSVRTHTWYSLSSSSLPHLLCITRRKKEEKNRSISQPLTRAPQLDRQPPGPPTPSDFAQALAQRPS